MERACNSSYLILLLFHLILALLSENVNVDINDGDVKEKSVMSLAKPSIMCRICLMNEDCER